jgi:hypothetical protein
MEGAHRQQMIAVAARGADQLWRESHEAGVTMERYWPRFVDRFAITRGPKPGIHDPLPPEPAAPTHPMADDGSGPTTGAPEPT